MNYVPTPEEEREARERHGEMFDAMISNWTIWFIDCPACGECD